MRNNLRKARQRKGYSQASLAARLGITQQSLSKHELSIASPSHFELIRMYEKELNIPAEELFPDIFHNDI